MVSVTKVPYSCESIFRRTSRLSWSSMQSFETVRLVDVLIGQIRFVHKPVYVRAIRSPESRNEAIAP